MAAASISLSCPSTSRRLLDSALSPLRFPSSLSTAHNSLPSPLRNPRYRPPFATMSVEAPMTSLDLALLERKESSSVLRFAKYHGLGNDFIMVDNRDSTEPRIAPEKAVKLCDRNFGIGADGVNFLLPGTNGMYYTMRIFNSDGSESEMCGNGIRCMARYIAELENLSEIQRLEFYPAFKDE